ncbi:MAG: SDR family NAD(P)-dependent oxidoreductase [Bacteroidetes bacterium]|nr:SDR family NAD(P)-dependent oxidoreductase [Bacteroidota bacterium]
MTERLNGPVALITGGTSGIGLAMAHQLAAAKYSLLLVSNQAKELEAVQAVMQETYPVRCLTFCIDLALPQSAQKVFDYSSAQNLSVEVLINNAGFLIFSEVVQTAPKKLEAILQLHMNTPAMMCHLFGREMKRNKRGFIMNVSSISTVMPYPGISLYGPSKTFLRYFTRALRNEMKVYGVGVTCLIPGATNTPLYDPKRVNISLATRLGIMQSPDFVARKAIRDMFCRKAESIPGLLNKLIVALLPLVPSWAIYLIHQKSNLLEKGSDTILE